MKKSNIINFIVFCFVFITVFLLQQKTEFLLDSNYDFLIALLISSIYLLISTPVNCWLDNKTKNKSKRKSRYKSQFNKK